MEMRHLQSNTASRPIGGLLVAISILILATAARGDDIAWVGSDGAFGDAANARRRFDLLRDSGISNAFVHKDQDQTPALYRIRIGPLGDVRDYDTLVSKLLKIGISESHLVTN